MKVLVCRCKEFLDEAKQMCQKVWVNFDDQVRYVATILRVEDNSLDQMCENKNVLVFMAIDLI